MRDYQGLPFTFSILAFSRQAVYESNEIFDEHVQSKPICYQPVLEIYIHIVLWLRDAASNESQISVI